MPNEDGYGFLLENKDTFTPWSLSCSYLRLSLLKMSTDNYNQYM